ncbi:MAG TPA: hypothetical protein VFT14_03980 [Solirubrobacterales bacterium]|nr:hypothetical protein [Solirubrobacterales bacterium]
MRLMGQDAHVLARLHRCEGAPRGATRSWLVVAVAVFAATLAIVLGTGAAGAAPRVVVLGAATPATPSCPTNCQAVGKTTGFQTGITGARNPFVVPFRGRVVAWSIKTGAPSTKPNPNNDNQSDMEFFNKTFGGAPSARIAVLKPIMKKVKAGKPIYKLKSQSPVEPLSDFLGQTTTFTLDTPLRVKPNNVVALSVPTWAPAFAINQSADTRWQASRKKTACTNTADILAGTPQEEVGSERAYGCVYKTARLLYSATVVADPNQPAPPKKKK